MAPVNGQVVGPFKVAIVAECEQRRVAHGGELTAQQHLRVARIRRIGSYSQKSGLGREVASGVRALLATRDGEEPKARFVEHARAERVDPSRGVVDGVGAQITAETGQERLLQHARPERIEFARVEQRSPRVSRVLIVELMIEPR